MEHNQEFVFPLMAYIREAMLEKFMLRLTYGEVAEFTQELDATIKASGLDLMLYDGTLYTKSWEPKKGKI